MSSEWLLFWFPIVLAAAAAGRVLDARRAGMFGILCALLWVTWSQAGHPFSEGIDVWSGAAILLGVAVVILLAVWSSRSSARPDPPGSKDRPRDASAPEAKSTLFQNELSRLSDIVTQFDAWMEHHRDQADPWPAFGEFIRSTLYGACQATHVRIYRLLPESQELTPILSGDSAFREEKYSARKGLIGHVATSGISYLASDKTQGSLIEDLARQTNEPIQWCFTVRHGLSKEGVVVVGEFEQPPTYVTSYYQLLEQAIGQFWGYLEEACGRRLAAGHDAVSGLPARSDFMRHAREALADSYRVREPAVVAVIALESLRYLNDAGRWDTADELVRTVGRTIQNRMRVDDYAGRFDESRLILFLRRVDSQLGSLILKQVLHQLREICGNAERWGTTISVRCGVAGSGTATPTLDRMIAEAIQLCHQARQSGAVLSLDLNQAVALTESAP